MSSFFDRFRPRAEPQHPHQFRGWGPAPEVQPARMPLPAALQALSTGAGDPRPEKYDPAIVIGLGATGNVVLRQWLASLAYDPAGPQHKLRAFLITKEKPASPLLQDVLPFRALSQLDLTSGSTFVNLRERPRSRREEVRLSFRQIANFETFHKFLHEGLVELHRNIRVMVVASVSEPEIGVIGEVLQALRLVRTGSDNPFLTLSALLTLDTPNSTDALDLAERYAALREIGRFTFNGLHVMEPLPGDRSREGVVREALLDHVLLVEAPASSQHTIGLRQATFEHGVGQAMAECLFTFLHPSARALWQNLNNDLAQSGEARRSAHEAVIHTLGIATLFVPVSELENYVAARLAQAAVYGERSDRPAEGLLARGAAQDTDSAGASAALIRRWLAGRPNSHKLFNWLLNEVGGPAALRFVPNVVVEEKSKFILALHTQMADDLTMFLNDRNEGDRLAQAHSALRALGDHLQTVSGWLAEAPGSHSPAHLALHDLLDRWREAVKNLVEEITAWEHALYADKPEVTPQKARPRSSVLSVDWRAATVTGQPAAAHLQIRPADYQAYLQSERHAAETALQAAGQDHIRRSLMADESVPLREAEAYYTRTVRPELSDFEKKENSPAFNHVRNRLGWWVRIAPDSQPELHLVCLPPEFSSTQSLVLPPESACFRPEAAADFCQAVLQAARAQARGLTTDLTGQWFQKRLDIMQDFLSRARHPLLSYDEQNAGARRAYMIARDKALAGRYKERALNLLSHEITELDGGEPARLTALTMRLNIPLETVLAVRVAYVRYRHQEQLHLYRQERNAALCERRIRASLGLAPGRSVMLPPELIMTLVAMREVTLFCQSVFHQLIAVHADDHTHTRQWAVSPLQSSFQLLRLATVTTSEARALWPALQAFILELPNDPQVELNPANHFAHERRDEFIETLLATARAARRAPEGRAQRDAFRRTYLAEWRQFGERDALGRAFAELLEAELDEPLWKDW